MIKHVNILPVLSLLLESHYFSPFSRCDSVYLCLPAPVSVSANSYVFCIFPFPPPPFFLSFPSFILPLLILLLCPCLSVCFCLFLCLPLSFHLRLLLHSFSHSLHLFFLSLSFPSSPFLPFIQTTNETSKGRRKKEEGGIRTSRTRHVISSKEDHTSSC